MKGTLLFTGFIFISTLGNAQKGYDLLGKGARAAGMAYAFNAIADDATGMSWNPAGITQLKNPEFAYVNTFSLANYKHPLDNRRKYNLLYSLDYIGFVYPLKLKMKDLVFGVSFQNRMNFKSDYSSISVDSSIIENSMNNVTVNSISLCGAYSLTRFLSFGFLYNQWFSLGNNADIKTYYNTKLIYGEDHETDEQYSRFSENFKYSGYNFSAGIMLDFASYHFPLRFAIKYDSRFILKNDHGATFRDDYIKGITLTYLRVYKGTEKFNFPGIIAMGLSYRMGEYFTIACDYDIRPFKNKDYTYNYSYHSHWEIDTSDAYYLPVDIDDAMDTSNFFESDENLNQFRIGLEYILHPKFALIPVRVGWKNNPTTMNSFKETQVDVFVPFKQVFAQSLNVGTGLITKRFSIDVAYEIYQHKRMDMYGYNEKKMVHFFVLSAIWYIK